MRKYTLVEVEKFERNKNGILYLPTGDYTLISRFGKWCSFGEGCSFGEWCSFGEGCKYCDFVFKVLINLSGLYKYQIRIYCNEDKYILSIGCHNFKTVTEAVEYGKKNNCYCKKTHEVVKKILS